MRKIVFIYRLSVLGLIIGIAVFIGYRAVITLRAVEEASRKPTRVTKELASLDSVIFKFSDSANLVVDEVWQVGKRREISFLTVDRKWKLLHYRLKIGAVNLDSLIKIESRESVVKTPMVAYSVVRKAGCAIAFQFDERSVEHSIHIVFSKGYFKKGEFTDKYSHFKIVTKDIAISYDNDDDVDFVFDSVKEKTFELAFYKNGGDLVCLVMFPINHKDSADSYLIKNILDTTNTSDR